MRSVVDWMMTLAIRPENWMSLAPMVSSTRSRLRSGVRRCALAMSSLSSSICAGALPGQAALVPGLGHSAMCWLPRNPASILAPEQPSGRNVTAIWLFSTARPSALRS